LLGVVCKLKANRIYCVEMTNPKQEPNPFENFQPSWMKEAVPAPPSPTQVEPALPLNNPAQANLSLDDLLLQEVIAPFAPAPVPTPAPAPAPAPASYSQPEYRSAPAYNPVPVYSNPTNPNSPPPVSNNVAANNYAVSDPIPAPVVQPAAVVGVSIDKPAKKNKAKQDAAKAKKGLGNVLTQLLIIVGVLAVGVAGYAALIAAQGGERQANSQPPTNVGNIMSYPNSLMINLTPTEILPYIDIASSSLQTISKQGCFVSSDNSTTLRQYYESHITSKGYTWQGLNGGGNIQSDFWKDRSGLGAILTIASIGYADFGLFNRATPGQTLFCVFNGPAKNDTVAPPVTDSGNNNSGNEGNSAQPTTSNNNNGQPQPPRSTPLPVGGGSGQPNPTPKSGQPPVATPAGGQPTVAPVTTKVVPPTPTLGPVDRGA
jgi:hypothetical protein